MNSFKKNVLKLLGLKYLFNNHTHEVHDITKEHENCRLDKIASHNMFYGTKNDYKGISEFYNGCRYCMKEMDKG